MIILGTLNTIADECKEKFSFQKAEINNAIHFIQNEFKQDDFIPQTNFESYKLIFTKKIALTLNKKAFIQREISAINKFIAEALYGLPDGERLFETIYKLILVSEVKEKTISRYYKLFNKNSIESFIRVLYSYDLIKYLCFLEGEPLENIKEKEIKPQIKNIGSEDDTKPELKIPEIALMQAYIFCFENGREITKGNASDFFKNTSYKMTSLPKLIKRFKDFKIEKNRFGFSSKLGGADTKHLNEQKVRFENILPILKLKYPKAHSKALADYKLLCEK